LETSPVILSYGTNPPDDGIVVERSADGVTVVVPRLPPGKRRALAAGTTLAGVLGPLAAAAMIAAYLPGGLAPFIVLAAILAPALFLRWFSATGHPTPDGPEAQFRLDARHLHVTIQTRAGPRTMTWPRGDIQFLRSRWFGTGLAIRVRGRLVAEVLHGHPLKARAAVAAALAEACAPCPTR
jgi:hypothetical protein